MISGRSQVNLAFCDTFQAENSPIWTALHHQILFKNLESGGFIQLQLDKGFLVGGRSQDTRSKLQPPGKKKLFAAKKYNFLCSKLQIGTLTQVWVKKICRQFATFLPNLTQSRKPGRSQDFFGIFFCYPFPPSLMNPIVGHKIFC